jgi:hypothetical protein
MYEYMYLKLIKLRKKPEFQDLGCATMGHSLTIFGAEVQVVENALDRI